MATSTAINVLNDDSLLLRITQAAHGLSVGNVVKYAAGSYQKAQANSPTNAIAVGIVDQVISVDQFVLLCSGYTNSQSGLTANTLYYLSPSTAGLLTATRPTAYNQVIKPVFYAISASAGFYLQGDTEMMGYPIQVVSAQSDAKMSSTDVIPWDNTKPQRTEGKEYLTATITPTSTTSKLLIEFIAPQWAGNGTQFPILGIFRSDQLDALLGYGGCINTAGTGFYCAVAVSVETVAGTTSALTISVRFGPDSAGTVYMNADDNNDQYLGGTWITHLKVTEIAG
jgi:hypothetical protein